MRCAKGLMSPVSGHPPGPHLLHNGVHLWVGGELGPANDGAGGTMTLNTSPNDPVFWLHHANVDRLWDRWQQIHGARYLPVEAPGLPRGQNLRQPMWPWRQSGLMVTPADVQDARAMGYAYARAPAARGG